METAASSAVSDSCIMGLPGASCGPAPGFRAAIAQLTDEHVRELSALHGEIALLRNIVTNSCTGAMTGSGEAGLCLDSLPESPKPSLRTEFSQHVSNKLVDGLSDDASVPLSGEGAMPKDEIIKNGPSSRSLDVRDSDRSIYDSHSEAGSQTDLGMAFSDDQTRMSKIESSAVGHNETIMSKIASETGSDYGSEIMALEARTTWTTEVPRLQHMRASTYDFGVRESVISSAHSMFPRFTDRCILGPLSSKHSSWVSLTSMALAYDLYFIPLTLGFELASNAVTDVGNFATRLIWTIDIPVTFCTAYYLPDMETLERSHIKIGLRYMKSWFILDATLVFVDWFLSMSGGDNKLSRVGRLGKFARFLRFLRMFRLLRVARFGAFIEKMLESIVDEAARLRFITIKIILMMMWLNHFLACGWYLVGSEVVNGHPGWALRAPAVATFFESYSSSMQWALTNFGVGSSRMYPETSAENLFAFFTMLFSLLIFATLLSTIANGYARMQAVRSDEITNMSQLRIYLAQNNVPDELCGRIIRQAKITVKLQRSKLQAQHVVLLQFLSPRMNAELQFVVFEKHIELSSLFSGLLKMNKDLMFTLSNEAMRDVHAPGGDVLFYRGQTATHMLMLPTDGYHGTVKYIGTHNARYLTPGRWICEACLWMPWIHMGSLKVSEACEQVQMNAEQFGKVIFAHPESYELVRDSALFFVRTLNATFLEEEPDRRHETLELYDTHAHIDWKGYLAGLLARQAGHLHRLSGRNQMFDAPTSTPMVSEQARPSRKSLHSSALAVKGVDSETLHMASRTLSSLLD